LVDQAITIVKDEFLDALYESENDTGDLDSPSSPGYPRPLSSNPNIDPADGPNASRVQGTAERNTLSDEIEASSPKTAVPESEPGGFDIGQIANVSFTNPGGVPLLGDPNEVKHPDPETADGFREPSLPTLEMESPLFETELPPRQVSPIVKLAPWLVGVAAIGMLLFYFLR
jgi:hypothetical protein